MSNVPGFIEVPTQVIVDLASAYEEVRLRSDRLYRDTTNRIYGLIRTRLGKMWWWSRLMAGGPVFRSGFKTDLHLRKWMHESIYGENHVYDLIGAEQFYQYSVPLGSSWLARGQAAAAVNLPNLLVSVEEFRQLQNGLDLYEAALKAWADSCPK